MEKRVKYNFIYNVIYQILAISVPLLTTPYLSRVLGPAAIGRYSYSYSIAYYFGLFILLGVNNYGCRSIALTRKKKNDLIQEFWNIYSIQFCLAIIILMIYVIYFVFIAKDKIISKIFVLYILSVGLDINWFFAGLEKFKVLTLRNSAVKIITTISIFLFVKDETSLNVYAAIMCIGFVISQLTLWIDFLRKNKIVIPQWNMVRQHIKPDIILFIPVLAISLFTIMDKIMLGYISGEIEVGYYESVEKVKNLPMALITALGAVMLPYISSKFSHLEDQYVSIISKCITFALMCASGMVFGLISVADIFVPLFYGKGYEKCIILYGLLLPSCIFIAFANVIRTQFLIPQNEDRIYVKSILLGATVNIIMNFFLIPQYQSYGAALASLCAEIIVCMYQAYCVRKVLPINKYIGYLLFFLLVGVGMVIVIQNITCLTDNKVKELIIKIIIGVIYYAFVLGMYFISIYIRKRH